MLFETRLEKFVRDEDLVRLGDEEAVNDTADFRGEFVERAIDKSAFWARHVNKLLDRSTAHSRHVVGKNEKKKVSESAVLKMV